MRLKKQKNLPRGAGVLLPVSSLPSPHGIGTFGRYAWEFVDFLHSAGQSYWQVLPLGPTSYGDSPYQSFSAFAGNPYLIDLDLLIREKLLTRREAASRRWGDDPAKIDYALLFRHRFQVLRLAFRRSGHRETPEYGAFLAENDFWLDDYAAYMALKEHFGWKAWTEWPEAIRRREPESLAALLAELREEMDFWRFCQFKFFRQWNALKAHANGLGIRIIGDIPIYVALDSADVWANPGLFELDGELNPAFVAGVPPDYFSATGQLWGNPLYRWDVMERDDFSWWRRRMGFSMRMYDIVRIDHFIGVVRYYAIPAGETTAERGAYRAGPGEKLVAALCEAVGEGTIIAEDLGVLTPEVVRLRRRAGYPGMKVMQFAFGSGPQNDHLPSRWERDCVVYGGTHDNETLEGFFSRQSRRTLAFAREYLGVKRSADIVPALIRTGYASCADTVIFQLQDLLRLGNEARINTPSTLGTNWRWRLLPGRLPDALAEKLRRLTYLYDRENSHENL